MKRYLVSLLLICWYSVASATLTVSIEPTKVQLDEPFRLTLTLDGGDVGGVPDLIPLQQDFIIQGTERSTSYTAINGQARSISHWSVILVAKKTGVLLIPAIRLGQQQSAPAQVTVVADSPAKVSNQPANGDAMLVAEVDQRTPYINEQVIYTVKLLNRQRLMEAEYQPPRIENALMVPMGEGHHYQTVLNGFTYEVDEQKYAAFPQKSGEITIIPPSFNALVYDFEPKRIHLKAKLVTLTVKPLPQSIDAGQWLPAKRVTLSEHYENTSNTMNEGDTLVRTVTLKATGVPAPLLPILAFPPSDQFSVYPEKQTAENKLNSGQLMGLATVKVTYLLNKGGAITIPSVRLNWFNTMTGQNEVTTLPARTIRVKGNVGTVQSSAVSTPFSLPSATPVLPKVNDPSNHYSLWLAVGFAAAWMLTLALWWFKPRTIKVRHNTNISLKRLQTACMSHDPLEVRTALLSWAAMQWPHRALLNLNDLTQLVHDTELKKQLHLLSLALYSQNGKTTWRGDALWRSIAAYKPLRSTQKNKDDALPPINPVG